MAVVYRENAVPSNEALEEVYASVGWISYTDHPGKALSALEASLYSVSAWDGDKLIGIIRAVGDGVSIVYIQDIIVLPEYQRQGIGAHMLNAVFEKFAHVRQTVLMTDDTEKTKAFYESVGMYKAERYEAVAYVKYNFKA